MMSVQGRLSKHAPQNAAGSRSHFARIFRPCAAGQAETHCLFGRWQPAYIATSSALLTGERLAVIAEIAKSRKPAMFTTPAWSAVGGLLAYGVSMEENFRRSASYADKILKGAKPGDLPIE